MAFKVDFSKFKKVSSDKDHTIMQHDDGHQIKIAHGALSHGMRKELNKLPAVKMYADGGNTTSGQDNPLDQDKLSKFHQNSMFNSQGKKPDQPAQQQDDNATQLAKSHGYANGGPVLGPKESDDEIIARKKEVDDYNNLHGDEPHTYPQSVEDRMGETDVKHYAEGTDDVQPAQAPSLADMSSQMSAMGAPAANPQAFAPQAPSSTQIQQTPDPTQPAAPRQPQFPNPAAGLPTDVNMGEARDKQITGIQGDAQAQAQAGAQQAKSFTDTAADLTKLAGNYQDQTKIINDQLADAREDVALGHIDPNKYYNSMDSGQKMMTGIALALGGLGGALSGGPNQAYDYLNRQIDRDIEAQKADLGKKTGLVSSLMEQGMNLKNSTDMAKILMLDHNKMMVEQATARAAGPEAKARGQQLMGQIDANLAPMVQQQALRQTLLSPSTDLKGQDPASFVNFMIKDPSTQKAVASEIERAQNTKRMSGHIMDQFDGVVKDYQSAGGLGRLPNMVRDNRGLQGLKALVNTTVTDLTGTARQAEFDSVAHNMLPAPGDTDSELSHKREIFSQYMQAKASAPLAKANGIDLDKFGSTNLKNPGGEPKPQYKIVGGVKYMRGPNGEAIKVD